jgi:AcrR family transcriptional regulator
VARRNYSSPVRTQHAEDTRRMIIEAAADLFTERGYANTSVAAVAAAAGVALNTVYTSVGGKSALLLALTEHGASDEAITETLGRIDVAETSYEIIRITAEGTSRVRQRQHRTLSLLLDNRTAHPDVAAAADLAARVTRQRLAHIADRLLKVGGLRPGLGTQQVADTLWFYFGFGAWRTLRGMNWSWEQATTWLTKQATSALLTPAGDS